MQAFRSIALALTSVLALLAALGTAACSSSSGDDGEAGGGGSNGGPSSGPGSGHGHEPEEEIIAEKEPNDGPMFPGFQDVGSFGDEKVITVKGRLSSGGNDGANYTGDFDVFAFAVTKAGGTLAMSLDWTGTADVDVVLYDQNLGALSSDGTTTKPLDSSGPIPAGTYAIALFSKDSPADYTMKLTYSLEGSAGTCVSTLVANPDGGCSFTLNEPENGASLTLPYTFGWRTDGCETPGHVYFYGNPPTETNWVSFEFTRGGQESLLNVTGTHTLTAADLAGITSDNGVYHWQVDSFYGGRSAGRTFTLNGAKCE